VQQLDLMIAFQAGQTLFGLLLAMLLTVFLFEFRHRFLKHWAFSCLALACYFGSSALMLVTLHSGGFSPGARLLMTGFSLATAYLHVVWLMIGTWEAVNERNISAPRHLLLITLAITVGVVSALLHPTGVQSSWIARLFADSLLFAVTGTAFIIAAIMLWRTLNPQRMLSSRLTPLAFIAYGLYMLYVSGVNAWININNTLVAHAPYLGIIGFLLLILIGYSIIIWLLEIERRRSASAWEKAQSAEKRLIHLRRHDAATGLPNRRQLQDQLFHEVRAASIRRNRVGILSIGIHRFNLVSQALGWSKTDELIRRLARRLKKFSPKNATLGRVGDRDFLLIIPDAGRREKTLALARWILTESATPLTEEGKELYLSLSGGLCFAPDDDIDPPALIKMAQQAQLRASETGETLVVHRASPSDSQPHDLLDLERELRTGVQEGQFCLYFQPLVSLRERRITGFETLLRWNHPERGVLTPGSFLQEAERLGVLDELEDQILEQALGQMREWQNEVALPKLSVSINISAQRFQQADLADKLASLLKQHEVDPRNLHVEITESTAMDDFDSGLNTISALRKLGCKVCLDDFGTGYSSLAHLRRLQVDYVKLDRSFLANLDRDPQERDLTRAIVDLIHSLNMTVLAEGVETRQQLGHMLQCRVDVIQGFLLGRPEPASHYRSALEKPQLVIA
jgi:diguanylate cyclase (GGDEF)-like protein